MIYPASELAQRHAAGVTETTTDSKVAYAGFADDTETPYREEWLHDPG